MSKREQAKRYWAFRPSAQDDKVGELLLYGFISADDSLGSFLFDDVSPKGFREELAALGPIDELRVYVNSDGGDVFAGQAIYSILKRLDAKVLAYVDGLAASIASLVVVAADRVIMPANAMMMIHSPWMEAKGNAQTFREYADNLDNVQEAMVEAYTAKSGLPASEVIDLLVAETWMTARQALGYGFADEIEAAKQIEAHVVEPRIWAVNDQTFDLRRFRHAPEDPAELLRDEQRIGTKRDAERALRDAGIAASRAKRLVSGIWEAASIQAAPLHGTYTGKHLHAHPTNGAQGSDVMHTHLHSHEGDYSHAHDHVEGALLQHPRDEAIPYRNTGKAAEGEAWTAPTLSDFTSKQWGDLTDAEKRHIAAHFVWTDSGNPPDSFSDLGGPHHKPSGTSGSVGVAVWRGVSSGRMQQASWAKDAGVRRHLAGHYHEFGRQAPWEASTDAEAEDLFQAHLQRRAADAADHLKELHHANH